MRHLFYVSQLYSLSILRPIQAAARARGDDCAWFFDPPIAGHDYLLNDEKLLSSVNEVISWLPDAVYVPGNVVPAFFPGIKVQIFHGLATDDTGKKGHYRIRGFFDLYCTRSPEETKKFKELEKKYAHFRVVETGWPKIDPLFLDQSIGIREKLSIDKPVVLFASTFSPSLTAAPTVFDTISRLSRSGKWHWLVTLHPKMETAIVEKYRQLKGPDLTFFESDQDVLPLLKAADAMLCDTSSIAIEFQMLIKPLVTFKNMNPGDQMINITEIDQIEGSLETAMTKPEELMVATREFIDKVHPCRDGKSSGRVLDAVDDFIDIYAGTLPEKPFNLLRKWKIRKKLHYYKFS